MNFEGWNLPDLKIFLRPRKTFSRATTCQSYCDRILTLEEILEMSGFHRPSGGKGRNFEKSMPLHGHRGHCAGESSHQPRWSASAQDLLLSGQAAKRKQRASQAQEQTGSAHAWSLPFPAHWTEACVTCRAAGEDAPPRRGDLAEMLWAESHANLGGGLHWTAVSRKQVLGADDEWEKPLGWADMQLRCLSAQDH